MSWFELTERNGVVYALVMLGLVIVVWPMRRHFWARLVSAMAFEIGLICALFSLWQLGNSLTHGHISGGLQRGRDIWHWERVLHVPSELATQQLVIGHPLVVRGLNLYYDTAHLICMGLFLVWLWFRHRDRYPQIRNALVLVTLTGLLVEMVPVAPPRLIGIPGLVDTAQYYGQSVYAAVGNLADQYSAFPSLHVAWAFLVSAGVVSASRSRWRWLFALYGPLTFFAVVVTANHYWADGAAALVLLAISWQLSRWLERPRLALRRRFAATEAPTLLTPDTPVPV